MVLLGCKPDGRHTEQHDVFFGIAESLAALLPQMLDFWPEAKGRLHIDAWREVNEVNGYGISVTERSLKLKANGGENANLYFINLGGYKQSEFEEFHYKMLVVGSGLAEVSLQAKNSAFYKHTGFTGAVSHIDDKYGIDIDDIYQLKDILPAVTKAKYNLQVYPDAQIPEDQWHLGYLKLDKLKNNI